MPNADFAISVLSQCCSMIARRRARQDSRCFWQDGSRAMAKICAPRLLTAGIAGGAIAQLALPQHTASNAVTSIDTLICNPARVKNFIRAFPSVAPVLSSNLVSLLVMTLD